MQICRLTKQNIRPALELIEEVFEQFVAPTYPEMGVKTFRHFIRYENISERIDKREMTFYGAYVETELAGVIAMRKPQHISLLFVKGKYHRRGIAKKLFGMVKAYYEEQKPEKPYITVNASPYATEMYKRLGFYPLDVEQLKDGIRFTPMVYRLHDITGE